MSYHVREVSSKSDLNKFIKLPWSIYQGDPHWVPPLITDMKTKLNPKKNPYFEHSDAKYFLAEEGGKVAGRIAATVNNNHNKFHEENIGFFGFFECIDNQSAANALFDKAAEYLRECNVDLMRGPANLTSNDDWGLLVDPFDSSPQVMMTYNPEYYIRLVLNYGFQKTMDLYAYWEAPHEVTERSIRVAEKLKKRLKITFRKVNMKIFWDEVEKIHGIYNSAWSRNWGFVPMTKHEFLHIAKDMKMILDPDFVYIAEDGEKPVGFCLTLPDANQAIKKVNGRLFPFGIFKLLSGMKKITRVRVLTMGVIPEYQKRGIDSIFYHESVETARRKNLDGGEFSWILENNEMMNAAAINLGARIYKTYRLYDYGL